MKIKNPIKEKFSIIVNAMVNDSSLSAGAKGVYCYLASKPDGWQFYIEDIAKHFSDKQTKIKTFIKDLETAGWLVRKTEPRKGQGQGFDWVWIVAEKPFTDEQIKELKPNPVTRKNDYNSKTTIIASDYNSENTNIVKSGVYNNTNCNSNIDYSSNIDSPTLRNTIPEGNTITSCYPQGQTNHISPVGDVLDGKRAANATDYAVPKVRTKPEDYGLVDFALQDIKVGDWERLLNWFEYHRREKNGKVIRPYVQSSFKQFANLLKELSGENWFYAMDAVEYAVNSCYRGFGDNMGFFYKLKSKEDYDEDLAFAKTLRSSPELLFERFQNLERYAPIVLDLAIELCDEQILQIHEAETRRKEAFDKLPDMDKRGGWFLDCFNEDMEKYKNNIAMVEKRKKWCEDKKISLQTKKII